MMTPWSKVAKTKMPNETCKIINTILLLSQGNILSSFFDLGKVLWENGLQWSLRRSGEVQERLPKQYLITALGRVLKAHHVRACKPHQNASAFHNDLVCLFSISNIEQSYVSISVLLALIYYLI